MTIVKITFPPGYKAECSARGCEAIFPEFDSDIHSKVELMRKARKEGWRIRAYSENKIYCPKHKSGKGGSRNFVEPPNKILLSESAKEKLSELIIKDKNKLEANQ